MERAGDVVRTAQNVAVVRCESDGHPDIGESVVDQNLGPVERPYLSVTPNRGVHLPSLVGQTLYVR